jgi:hypothetical protein
MRALSPAAFACASMLLVAGCNGVNFGDKAQGGAAASSTADASDSGADASKATNGIDCIIEPTTGATLCTAVSTCPSIAVDHDVYPNCGFRMKSGTTTSTTMILECACNGALCPIGVPTTCEQARKLLADQTEPLVCNQVADGRCN